MAIIPLSLLTITFVNAKTAKEQFAKIEFIRGNKELWIETQGKRYPADKDSRMQRNQDRLIVNGNSQTHAILKFFSQQNQDLSMFVKTVPHRTSAVYKFPCQVQGGSFLFGWTLSQNPSSTCQEIKVQKGQPTHNSQKPTSQFVALKQSFLSQDWEVEYTYCSVVSNSGQSWFNIKTKDSCSQIMEECSATSDDCNLMTMGDWWTTETEDLTAVVQCANQSPFTAKGSPPQMKKIAQNLYQEAIASGGKSCSVQLYRPDDLAIIPPSPPEIANLKTNEPIMLLTSDTGSCPEIKVLSGAIKIKSLNNLQGVSVNQGMKTNLNFCETAQTTSFNLEQEKKSVNVEILEAYNQGYNFCEDQVVSGGTGRTEQYLQLTDNKGKLKLEYEMYGVPDSLQIFYEGKEIYSTYNATRTDRKVSGSDTVFIPFEGTSGRVKVLVIGNESTETKWTYTLSCPQ